ncbi:hypothetical protein LTR84_004721 [Exophiala bonariae]|uniref:Major facilitator superfamily (MFS) profile domain-containing protein n=1 Tax=Exophiala bonariae TaxID=1690606 RepID=A0AAV9NND3_9EURO|nr:hypothetical protein LTR84_004721 [Exophiala bonariae]
MWYGAPNLSDIITANFLAPQSFALYGYDAGVLGGVQHTKPFLSAMKNPTGAYVIPMIASSYTLAAAVCALFVACVGMPLGRRNCLLLGNGLVIIGGALQAAAWSVSQMIVGRVICGLGIGFISSTTPTFLAEMCLESEQRGPDVASMCIWLVGGCAFAYWVDFGFTRMDNQVSWRVPIGLQTIFALVSGSGILLLPDTPRWYFARNRDDEGLKVLSRLYDLSIDHEQVQEMMETIRTSIKLEEQDEHRFNWLDLFWDRSDLKVGRRVRISFLILSMQQMMGINLSVYYSTVIFSQVGLSPFLSQLLAAIMNTLFATGTVFLPFTIERFGRRNILMYSAVGLTICMAIFVGMISQAKPTLGMQWTAVAFVVIYNFIFGYGWIGVCWLYGPEIAPLKFRHIGGAAGAFGEWLFSFITVFAGGIALEKIGWRIWIWMLLSCAAAVPFVYFMCPETTGKSLEEIDLIFATQSVKDSRLASELIAHTHHKQGETGSIIHEEKV